MIELFRLYLYNDNNNNINQIATLKKPTCNSSAKEMFLCVDIFLVLLVITISKHEATNVNVAVND